MILDIFNRNGINGKVNLATIQKYFGIDELKGKEGCNNR